MVLHRRSHGLVAIIALLGAARARAGDTTKPVFDGVTMITRTTSAPNNVIHILVVDMTKPGAFVAAALGQEVGTLVTVVR